MSVVYPREVLNRLKWSDHTLEKACITYVHRGAPGDVRTICGSDIVQLGRSFFETNDSTIPYHRIVRIEVDGNILFGKIEKEGVSEGRPNQRG